MTRVTKILQDSPENIRKESEEVAGKRALLDQANRNLRVAEAMATVKYQDAKNQSVLKALIIQDADVQKWEGEVITRLAEYKLAEINLIKAENQFTSARKLASLQITESDIL